MDNNKTSKMKKILLAIPFFLAGLFPLAGQETTGNYYVRQSGTGEQRIIQHLTWPGDENASHYEVEVERGNQAGAFTPTHTERTEASWLDVSLGPGRYRYRVRVFNLLNQVEHTTNWASFNIILAVQPEITRFTPDALYIHEHFGWEVRLTGKNLVPDAEVYLVPYGAMGENIVPAKYTPMGDSAVLEFDPRNLREGSYTILIRNPGGLETTAGTLPVDTFIPYDIQLSAGYAPLVPAYGYLFDALSGFAPAGADLRASFVFFKRPWGFLGVEANLHFHLLSDTTFAADVSAYITDGIANLLYRKILPLRFLVFNARLGAGLGAVPYNLEFDYGGYTTDPLTSWVILLNAGASLEWRFAPSLYAELGTDFTQAVSGDTPLPGFLRPFINIGWKFQ